MGPFFMGIRKFIIVKSVGMYINMLGLLRPKMAARLAYRFFSEPREGRLEPHSLPEILQKARREVISDGNGDYLSYTWPGGEHVSLLVHGWESNAARWERMLPHLLEAGHTVVALDGPAHGLSHGREFNVPAYAELIEKAVQKYRPHFLIGHSMGGSACVYHQYKYGAGNLRKMILLGAPSDLSVLVGNYARTLSLSTRVLSHLGQYFVDRFSIDPEDFSGGKFAKSFTLPGVIAHDLEDTIVAFDESRKIAGGWQGATFIETRGLGHSMHDEDLYKQIMVHLSA